MIKSHILSPGLYVHVPFCLSKCAYCDFYSLTDHALIPDWLAALEKEAFLYQDRFGVFDTLYLGGGTPSLLDTGRFAVLMQSLRRHFSFSRDIEVTLEANPDDLTSEKIKLYKDLGVNRLSLGVQSFDDRELSFLGRRHNTRQTLEALEALRNAGFANLSLDLIYGLPGQSLADWRQTLEQALAFAPEHLSCYQLTYEPGTPLGRKSARGEVIPATEEEERDSFLFTSHFLETRGYFHYEISNFARLREPENETIYHINLDADRNLIHSIPPPHGGRGLGGGDSSVASLPHKAQFLANEECSTGLTDNQESSNRKPKTENRKRYYYSRHNRKYWRHAPYLGLGPGAHSFQDGRRWWNIPSVGQYCQALAQGRAPVAQREVLSPPQLRLEALYLGLRTKDGVPLDLLRQTPGWRQILKALQKAGLIEVIRDRAIPTRRGFLLADSLPLRFMDGGLGNKDMDYPRGKAGTPGPWPLTPAPCRNALQDDNRRGT
ncbi:MAG: radical SAM family heme chaperone HemW [Thermodesulfobacteriota bacterium]